MMFEALHKRSVGIIIPDFDYGGEEKRALFFANNYAEHFKKVYFFAPAGAQSKSIDSRVQQVQIKIRGYKNMLQVLRYVRQQNIDFIQGHKRTTFPYLYAIEKFTKARVNFNFDNIYLDKEWLYRLAPKRLYYLSDYMREHYLKWFPDKENATINMGGEFYQSIAAEEKNNLRASLNIQGRFVLISLGRLSDQKNQEVTLQALSTIKDKSIVCLMVGEGPKETILKKMVHDLNIQDKVLFLGHRSDVDKLLNITDALVQSSIFEGFPNVFIEAASLAVPIITTKVGSYSTLVHDNGIAVEVNDVQGLAAAIMQMKNNFVHYSDNAKRLRESEHFQQFHKSKMLHNYLASYNNEAQNMDRK